MEDKAVTVIGHGSRKTISNALLAELVEVYKEGRTDLAINYGFIELAEPHMTASLIEAAKQSNSVTALPLQLFRGNHIKKDIPEALEEASQSCDGKSFHCADALGTHHSVIELAYLRGTETEIFKNHSEEEITAILVGRGSIEQDSLNDFEIVLESIRENHNFKEVFPAFIAISDPPLDNCLTDVIKQGHDKILILPYFLLTGVLMDRIHAMGETFQKENPQVEINVAEALGAHPKLFHALDERLNTAKPLINQA